MAVIFMNNEYKTKGQNFFRSVLFYILSGIIQAVRLPVCFLSATPSLLYSDKEKFFHIRLYDKH